MSGENPESKIANPKWQPFQNHHAIATLFELTSPLPVVLHYTINILRAQYCLEYTHQDKTETWRKVVLQIKERVHTINV